MLKINVKSKSVYGRELWYPTCDKGRAIAKLIRGGVVEKLVKSKTGLTIPPRTRGLLEKSGYDIQVEI